VVGGFLRHEGIDQILEFRIPLNGCGAHLKADLEKQVVVAMPGVEPAFFHHWEVVIVSCGESGDSFRSRRGLGGPGELFFAVLCQGDERIPVVFFGQTSHPGSGEGGPGGRVSLSFAVFCVGRSVSIR
jgi:hypothetical protein